MSDLRNVPGIGAKKDADLIALGYPTLEALKDADPDELYLRASLNAGETLGKCVLYAFRCAAACAKGPAPDPMKYRWWYFCDKDKKEKSIPLWQRRSSFSTAVPAGTGTPRR